MKSGASAEPIVVDYLLRLAEPALIFAEASVVACNVRRAAHAASIYASINAGFSLITRCKTRLPLSTLYIQFHADSYPKAIVF
jgi:hypothetical protein